MVTWNSTLELPKCRLDGEKHSAFHGLHNNHCPLPPGRDSFSVIPHPNKLSISTLYTPNPNTTLITK